MSNPEPVSTQACELFDREEVEGVLEGSFYSSAPPPSQARPTKKAKAQKPTHYKVICISMYTDALGRLDDMVTELKGRGYTKANRSALIRHALDLVDLDEVPRGL